MTRFCTFWLLMPNTQKKATSVRQHVYVFVCLFVCFFLEEVDLYLRKDKVCDLQKAVESTAAPVQAS